MPAADTFQIKDYEKKILSQEQKIEKLEKKIEKEEGAILKFQKALMRRVGLKGLIRDGLGKHGAKVLRLGILRNFAKKKFIYSVTIIIAVVLVWRGIWHLADVTPWISNPFVSVVIGLAVLWGVNKYTRLI